MATAKPILPSGPNGPPTVNEALRNAAIDRAANLHLYSNGVTRQAQALLSRADLDLAAQLAAAWQALPEGQSTTARIERLDAQLVALRELIRRSHDELERLLLREMVGLSADELDFQVALLAEVKAALQALAPLRPMLATATVVPDQVFAATLSRPFQGRLLREWMQTLAADKALRVRDAVRVAYLEGQTVDQVVRRLRGTRAAGYADGLLAVERRQAEAVVRTALAHTAGEAREQFSRANADLIKAKQWVSTLDSRTTPACQVRDGLTYGLDNRPLGHAVPWLSGPGRLHWNCRSTSVPVMKSWRELGLDMAEIGPGQRASMDGAVPAELTYREWLGTQSAERQDQILGPARGRLLRQGRLPVERLWDNKGHYLSLDELAARNAQGVARAFQGDA